MSAEGFKERASGYIESVKKDLFELSLKIHSQPETAYQEKTACRTLEDFLYKTGFTIEHGIGGIETAFRASQGTKGNGPTVAFMAEYDALPGIGHGCGHNLIASGAAGAAMGAAAVLNDSGLNGRIEVIGTPAEEYTEGKAGKVLLLEAGIFDAVDICLMFHPWTETIAIANDLGFKVMDVTFKGKTAHAASDPWNGINALDGVVLTYVGISALRQQVRDDARIHIIITEGGKVVNVVPDQAKARIMFRSKDIDYLEELDRKIEACIKGASIASLAKVRTDKLTKIYATRFNEVLFQIVSDNFKFFKIELRKPDNLPISGDFGNVSHRVPSFGFMMKTHPENVPWHSVEARDGAIKQAGHEGMIMAAKVLAMSAIDIIVREDLMKRIKQEFTAR